MFVLCCLVFLTMPTAAEPEPRSTEKAHHTRDGFRNPYLDEESRFFDFLKWRWRRMFQQLPEAESYRFALAENDPASLVANVKKKTVTWIGHATLLLQLDGRNILTDPVFSERASPVQWAGPRRVVPPGIALADLPKIDIVVISHDHYDALDSDSIRQLYQRSGGNQTVFLVPLGLKDWFDGLGIQKVYELDWWEERMTAGLKIVAVPVQHWSKRNMFSRNRSLWAGWVILSPGFRFFFSGDSGYAAHFTEIGEKFGPFDLAAIPIGAYEPRWFMRDYHMNPAEALQVHFDLKSRKSVGIHWGTFPLTDEPLNEPPEKLARVLRTQRVPEQEFIVLQHGETRVLE